MSVHQLGILFQDYELLLYSTAWCSSSVGLLSYMLPVMKHLCEDHSTSSRMFDNGSLLGYSYMLLVMKHLCEEHSTARMFDDRSLLGYTYLADLHWCWLWRWLGHGLLYSVVVHGFYSIFRLLWVVCTNHPLIHSNTCFLGYCADFSLQTANLLGKRMCTVMELLYSCFHLECLKVAEVDMTFGVSSADSVVNSFFLPAKLSSKILSTILVHVALSWSVVF